MPPDTSARDGFLRALSIARRTLRAYLLIGGVFAAGAVASLVVALAWPRLYRSETLMLYREGIRSTDLVGGDAAVDPARKLGMKLREIVLSRTSLQQIIDEFHLYRSTVEDRGYVEAVDEMRNHIAFRIRDGDTFGLSFEGDEPKQVQAVTARLAEALIRENSRNRVEQATATKEFLDRERVKSEQDLKEKETRLVQFLAEHPEFAREAMLSTIPTVEAKHIARPADNTLLVLERHARRIAQEIDAPEGPKRTTAVVDGRLLAARAQAESELREAERDLENKRAQFTDRHPDVLSARARVPILEEKLRRIDEEIAQVAPSAAPEPPVDREALRRSLAKVNAEIAAYRARGARADRPEASPVQDANRIVALETRWTQLNREVMEAREWQKQVGDRQFRADITASSVSANRAAQMVIIDPPYLPTHPVKGSRTAIVLVGLVLALGLGLLTSLARALLDDRVYERADLVRLDLAELLAAVPRAPPAERAADA